MSGPELTTVESPFIDQLIAMGWKLVTGNLERIDLRDGKRRHDRAQLASGPAARLRPSCCEDAPRDQEPAVSPGRSGDVCGSAAPQSREGRPWRTC
jgi:hypothetical protein